MKIVYTGALYTPYLSTSLMRMQALEELGHEVHSHCLVPYNKWGGRWGGALFRRYLFGPPLHRYNKDLVSLVHQVKPDVLWVDKGRWLFPTTLKAIQEQGVMAVSYTPDPAFLFHQSRWFLGCIPLYDIMVTTKLYEADLYRQHGVQRLIEQVPSFNPKLHKPQDPTSEEQKTYACDLVFIGTYTPRRDKYLRPLAESGLDLAIWGGQWLTSCKDPILRRHVRGEGLSGRDYSLGIACAKIGLGLLTPLAPDTSTTRSVEIPAIGTFMLAERTEEHLRMFEEGTEAAFFDNADELITKARYFLAHPEKREAIAAAGRQRSITSGYDINSMIAEIVQELEALQKETYSQGQQSP